MVLGLRAGLRRVHTHFERRNPSGSSRPVRGMCFVAGMGGKLRRVGFGRIFGSADDGAGVSGGCRSATRRVPRHQRDTFKPTPPHLFFLLAAYFQQVPQEELLVPPLHPFWGDVSSYSRCEAALLFSGHGTTPDRSHRRSKTASEETACVGHLGRSTDGLIRSRWFQSKMIWRRK